MDRGYVHGCPIAGLPVRVGMNDVRREVLAAVDVCYLRPGGARAAAVTAGDAAISAIQAWWTAPVPAALPYRSANCSCGNCLACTAWTAYPGRRGSPS
jgi:hypothetical protein